MWNEFTNAVGSLAAKWTACAALGTFLLYLFGYLALRFQLSMYGVATNLDAFDEKYLFAGCRFLVYLVSSVPTVLLVVAVLVAVFYLPYKLVPGSAKARIRQWSVSWLTRPNVLPFAGTMLSLALIQFVLRNPFIYGNVLLRSQLPEHEWINAILLTSSGNRSFYFVGLVGVVALTAGLLWGAVRRGAGGTTLSKSLIGLFTFLVAVEFLLLPVNYGILIASQELPRVSELGGDEKLPDGAEAWLVWDNKDGLTYLVREAGDKRNLLAIPRKDAKVKIVAYDPIFRILFAGE